MPGPYGGALPGASALNPVPGVSRSTATTETNSIIALSTRVDRILTELASHYSDTNAHNLASYTGGALPISGGGTGATTAAAARAALGTNSAANITTGTLAIAQGGTGSATAAAARAALGTDVATNVTSGQFAVARLGSGAVGSGNLFLSDAGTFLTPPGGGGGSFDGPWIFGKTYGVTGNGSDQTAALTNALFVAGGTTGKPPVVLPAGVILCPDGIAETIDSLTVIGSAVPRVSPGAFAETSGTVIKVTTLGKWAWQHYNNTYASANNYFGPKFLGVTFEGTTQTGTVAAADNGRNVASYFTGTQTFTMASSTLTGSVSIPTPGDQCIIPLARSATTDPVLYCTVTGLTGGSGKAVLSYTGVSGAALQNVQWISGAGTTATGNTVVFGSAGGLSIEVANSVVEDCMAVNFQAGIGFRVGTPVGAPAGGDAAWGDWRNLKAQNCAIGYDLGRQEAGTTQAGGDYWGLTDECTSATPNITNAGVGILIRYQSGGHINVYGGKDEGAYYGVLHRGEFDVIVGRKSEACNYLISQVRPVGATGASRNDTEIHTGSGGIIEIGARNECDSIRYRGSGVTVTNNALNCLVTGDTNTITHRAEINDVVDIVDTASGGTILTRSVFGSTAVVRDALAAGKQWVFHSGDTTAVENFRFEDSAAAALLRIYSNGDVIISKSAAAFTVNGALTHAGTTAGFFGHAAAAKPTVTGSKGANAALTSLLTALAGLGLLTDSST